MWVVDRPLSLSGHSNFNCSSIDNILHIWIHVSPYTGEITSCLFYHERLWNMRLGKSYLQDIYPSALPRWPVWPLYWPWLAKCNTSISSVTLKASQDLYILSSSLLLPDLSSISPVKLLFIDGCLKIEQILIWNSTWWKIPWKFHPISFS